MTIIAVPPAVRNPETKSGARGYVTVGRGERAKARAWSEICHRRGLPFIMVDCCGERAEVLLDVLGLELSIAGRIFGAARKIYRRFVPRERWGVQAYASPGAGYISAFLPIEEAHRLADALAGAFVPGPGGAP